MPTRWWLFLGDVVFLAGVMLLGFVFHGSLEPAAWLRWLWGVTVLSLTWLLAAWSTGALDPDKAAAPQSWWRWLRAVVLAVPLALVVYTAPQGRAVPFSFALTMSIFSFLAVATWRLLFWWLYARRA